MNIIKEDWLAHNKDWTRPGLHALLIHRFGVWRLQIKNPWVRKPLSLLYKAFFILIRNIYSIELPESCHIGRRVVIEHNGPIVIHGNSKIGDECILRQGVTLGLRRIQEPYKAPTLGKKVSLGANAILLGDIQIGDNTQIGAGAVVTKNVPPNSKVIGNPAKIFTETP